MKSDVFGELNNTEKQRKTHSACSDKDLQSKIERLFYMI